MVQPSDIDVIKALELTPQRVTRLVDQAVQQMDTEGVARVTFEVPPKNLTTLNFIDPEGIIIVAGPTIRVDTRVDKVILSPGSRPWGSYGKSITFIIHLKV